VIVNRPVIIQGNSDFAKHSDVAGSTSIPSAVNFIRVAGFTSQGDGGAALYTRSASEPSHAGKIQDNNGVWWKLAPNQHANPFMFGAKGDGSTDDAEALQDFFDYIADNDVGTANMTGSFLTSAALTIGPSSGTSETRHFSGRMSITATAAIDVVVSLKNLDYAVWDGILEVTGVGGASPATRTCTTGIKTADGNNRFKIGGLAVHTFKGWGIFINSDSGAVNQNASTYGLLRASSCGSSYQSGSAITGSPANFSARTDAGSSGSLGQSSLLTVDVLPETWIDSTVGTHPHCIYYSGRAYYILAVDRGASTITVFPWLVDAATTGAFNYVTGGGIHVYGGNAGQLSVDAVDVSNSAFGYIQSAIYGSDVANLQSQSNVIGLALGAHVGGGMWGGTFDHPYFEINLIDILKITQAAPPTFSCTLVAPTFSDGLEKMQPLVARTTAGNWTPTGNNFRGVSGFGEFGGSYEKAADSLQTSTYGFALDRPDKSLRIHRSTSNSVTIALSADDDLNAVYGYDSGEFCLSGTGSTGQYTGTLTFDPPSGETINGGVADATLAFAGFYGPAVFKIIRVAEDWKIHLISGRDHPEAVTTIATNADATLTPWSTNPTVIHTGTLTADRAITLATTNAVAGKTRFRITRTGGGAFNLNVGTGPLKALATNTWGEFIYNGSAWYLAAYGAL
jgi:hypothetical protein